MVVLSEVTEQSSSSSSVDGLIYDVFISFRGSDTRGGFTSYLYDALMDANFNTFLDDEEIQTGQDLKPELKSAIKASNAFIIVLSKSYANSSWCLDELVLILKQLKKFKRIIIPVFYHVEPTHVRKQESIFGISMAEHEQKMEAETDGNRKIQLAKKISQWKKALTKVANLKGMDINGRLDTEFITEIVEEIYLSSRIFSRPVLPNLVGVRDSIKFLSSWMKDDSSDTRDILTILGMVGIGKTSLAEYMYMLHSREFHTSCFVGNISRLCKEMNGMILLQKQLYHDISKTKPIQVPISSMYTTMIENALAR